MERQRLDGWKEIARYFGRTKRAVQNWQADGLPVRRVRRRVYAYVDELESWKAAQDLPPPRAGGEFVELRVRVRRVRLAVAAVVALLGIGLTVWVFSGRPSRSGIAGAALQDSELAVFDARGEEIWRRRFPPVRDRLLSFRQEPATPLVMDVDGDGESEVLVSLTPVEWKGEMGRLLCLDSAGETRWELVYGRELQIRGRHFTRTFGLVFLDRVSVGGRELLLVIARHSLWYPLQVALVDPASGALLDEYWHPGYVYSRLFADLDGDGEVEVLLGATNNPDFGPGHPALLVLDLPFGPARQGPEAEMHPYGPQYAKELSYLLFPLPDVARAQDTGASFIALALQGPDQIRADLSLGNGVSLFYSLGRRLEVEDVRASGLYVSEHARLAAAGLLDHRFREEELARYLWRAVRFPTAPHGNSPEVALRFEKPRRRQKPP